MFRATDTIQIRWDQVPPAERLCSPILADFGRDRAETSLLQGLVDAQIDQVELSTSSPRPTAGVVSSPRTRIFGQPNDVCLRKSLETNKSPTAFRNHDRVFSDRSRSGARGTTKWAAPVWKNPQSTARRWRTLDDAQGPMRYPCSDRDCRFQGLSRDRFSEFPDLFVSPRLTIQTSSRDKDATKYFIVYS